MTPEAQRIAIAEACGWHEIGQFLHDSGEVVLGGMMPGHKRSEDDIPTPLPDYPADLNAMHEAERVLTMEQWISYWSFIEAQLPRDGSVSILHATAAQRAEAFLRTLGKWEDGK